ncbi:uncharacterized protein [Clytia hemisphaerica]|uniref:uncharacterized protein n=1 Tax=Clytia hemisphaerica TaxID=252671 RepID=UPI0034D51BAC
MTGNKRDGFSYKKWLKNRKITTRTFYYMSFVDGIEYTLTFATLFVYLRDFLKVSGSDLDMFYSRISGLYLLSAILSALIVGKMFDKIRRARLMLCIITLVSIIGNVLYTIPKSPYFLLIGRVLAGMGDSYNPIILSELTRSYPPEEVLAQLTAISCAFMLGCMIGPCINFIFIRADFWFLGVHIKYANGTSLLVCFMYIISFFLIFFFVTDLSRHFDLKEAIQNLDGKELESFANGNQDNDEKTKKCYEESSLIQMKSGKQTHDDSIEECHDATTPLLVEAKTLSLSKSTIGQPINESGETCPVLDKRMHTLNETGAIDARFATIGQPTDDSDETHHELDKSTHIQSHGTENTAIDTMFILRKLFTNFDLALIFAMSFVVSFALVTCDLWIPLACLKLLHWDNLEVNIVLIAEGAVSLIFIVVLIYKEPKDEKLYYLGLISWMCMIILYGIFMFFKLDQGNFIWLDSTLWLVETLCTSVMYMGEELFLIGSLAKMVPSNVQAFAQGVRLIFSRFGAALGLFTAAFTFHRLEYFCPILFGVAILLALLLVVRRKYFCNPVQIF